MPYSGEDACFCRSNGYATRAQKRPPPKPKPNQTTFTRILTASSFPPQSSAGPRFTYKRWFRRRALILAVPFPLPIILPRARSLALLVFFYPHPLRQQEETKARERATTRRNFMQRARAAEARGDLREAQNKRRVSQRKAIRVLEIRAKDGAARNIQVIRYLDYCATFNGTIAGRQQNQTATGLLFVFQLIKWIR